MINYTTYTRSLVIAFLATLLTLGSFACSEDVDSNSGDVDVPDVTETDAGDHDDTDRADTDGDSEGDGDSDATDVGDAENDGDSDPDAGDPDGGDSDPDGDGVVALPDLQIDGINPNRGPVTGGTPFVIEGEGFTENSVVLFGITEVAVDLIEETLTGTTPAGEAVGPVTVRVIDEETGEDFINDGFTYVEPLRLNSVQPSILSVHGGVEISLYGQGFTEDTRVTIGSSPVPGQTVLTSGHMRVIAPPNSAGTADIRLTDLNSSYLAVDAVSYISPVRLTDVTPPVGSTAGGDTVILEGSGFSNDIEVYFGGTPATVTDINPSRTRLTVTTPAHVSGIVHVNVETEDDGAILPNAFAFIGDGGGDPSLDGVFPAHGLTTGGEEVYLVGQFDANASPDVTFGTSAANVLSVENEVIIVETPSADVGVVDVLVEYDSNSLLLEKGFTYFAELTVDDLDPSEGPTAGGTTVTVTGSGFTDAETVSLGGVSVAFEVVDDETIVFTTLPSNGGHADLIITSGGNQTANTNDAFFFTETLELWSQSPTRGSIAGNTYVEIRGQGFTSNTEIFFGDAPAASVNVLDPYTLAARTPPHPSGTVEVSATDNGADALSPDLYTFFNPGAPSGGAWGNPIDGAVNVIVFSYMGSPVENAFVMLSTNANTPYAGVTDANGMVTLSGPDILGEQTITAAAADHSSTTVQRVNAENVTIFLHSDEEGEGFFPPPPPTATYTGNIDGLDKINRPDTDEILMAIVYSTRPTMHDDIPDPGAENVVLEDGQYTITTRIGDLALVAIGGLYNTVDQSFTPTRMGTVRHLTASDGGTYVEDIDLDIPLNQNIELKFNQSPVGTPGPDFNQAILYLDLGFDGVFGPMEVYETTDEVTSLDRVAPLMGSISDASYTVIASAESNDGIPYSETTLREITNLDRLNSTAPMTSTINFTAPAFGGVPQDGLVQWEYHGSVIPDLHFFYLENQMGDVVWEIFLPGNATSFQFPDFPDLSEYEMEDVPFPYPGGSYFLVNIAISKDGVTGDSFSYDDLGLNSFSAYSVHAMPIGL